MAKSQTARLLDLHDRATQAEMELLDLCHVFDYKNENVKFSKPKEQIRLLSIAMDGPDVSCQIKVCMLNPELSYHALSYCWGKQLPTKAITINSALFLITPHLWEILRQIATSTNEYLLWVDAICIDQKDMTEKNIQLALMGRIYTTARCVLIWLGVAEDDSDAAMEQIQRFNTLLAPVRGPIRNDDDLPDACPKRQNAVWRAFGRLYARPWFLRLWVFQEAVLANEIEILCGAISVQGTPFFELAANFTRLGLLSRLRGGVEVDLERGDGIAALAHISIAREKRRIGNDLALTPLLLSLRLKEVTDPRDRINGALGCINDSTLASRLQVNYKEYAGNDYWKAYLQAGKILIEQDPIALLSMSASTERPPGLPTWCANFDKPCPYTSFISKMYAAGISVIKERRIFNSFNADSIEAWGTCADEVLEVVPDTFQWPDSDAVGIGVEFSAKRTRVAEECIKWESACVTISQNLFGNSTDVPEEHWRTLIANRIITERPEKPAGPRNRAQDYLFMRQCLQGFTNAKTPTLRGYDHPAIPDLMEYVNNVINACQGRQFFSTEGGRIGLGPSGIRKRDRVCVFYGARTPYILRRKEVSEHGEWELVGDAYVHGIMQGEALKLHEDGKSGVEEMIFTIG